jgi:glycosyltransferase involved in cell wall biosynthesis
VVSYAVAAAAEHVDDGVSGRLVAPGDEAAYIAAVQSLTDATRPLEPMRAAARAAARRATWPEVLARFEARLEDTVHALETPPARVPVVA